MKFTVVAALAVFLSPALAQVNVLESLDLTGFTAAQKKTLSNVLQADNCTCGCNWTIAKCRTDDPKCGVSKSLVNLIIKDLKAGKTQPQIMADLKAHALEPPPVLDDPVKLNIQGDPVVGPPTAKITIVEFSDFQCPFCAAAVEQARLLLQKYPKDVRLVFKQFPLDDHSQAEVSAEAALAAHAQGKFWPMHDKLYANFRTISRARIMDWAKELGLDMNRFTQDLDSHKYKSAVDNEEKQGETAGVQGTPTFFFNGRRYSGAFNAPDVEKVLQTEFKLTASQ